MIVWGGFVGLITQIWDRVAKTIVEIVSSWLDEHIRDFAYGYRRRYFRHLIHRHRTFDVKGLTTQSVYSLEIEQVYVDLSIQPNQVTAASSSIIQKISSASGRGMWDFLASVQLKSQNFAIIGSPGSGKTTLLKHITLALAAHNGIYNAQKYIPVLLFIRDHAELIGAKETVSVSLEDVILESINRMGIPAPVDWFKRVLAAGRCLVLFDGLDEVADANLRRKVASWVQDQTTAYGANRFILTSRPFGYKSNPIAGVTVLEVRPFSLDQVRNFVNRWYLANEVMSAQKNDEGVRIAAREAAEKLLQRLRSTPALLDLAVNPLLLTMITTVHRYRGSLPGRRVELYSEICDVFLGKRQEARGLILELTPAQKKRVLQPLAFHMMCHEKREISLEEASKAIQASLTLVNPNMTCNEFLEMIENSSGLLLQREAGVFNFAHLTFQEYLAASHIMEGQLESELVKQVGLSWWHETIRLYSAIGEASRIIEACISGARPTVKALTLAIECVEEARAVEATLRIAVNSIITSGVEDPDSERRRLAGETMLNLRLRSMIRLDDNRYIDDRLISVSEYQLFSDLQHAEGRLRQPDYWSSFTPPLRTTKDAVVGTRFSDALAFCSWLGERDSGGWLFELPDDSVSNLLSGHSGYWSKEKHFKRPSSAGKQSSKTLLDILLTRLSRDRNIVRDNHVALTFSDKSPVDLEAELPTFLELQHGNKTFCVDDCVVDLELDFDRIFALDEERVLDIARAQELERVRNIEHAQTLDKNIALIYLGRLVNWFDPKARKDFQLLSKFERVREFHRRYFANDSNFSQNLDWARKLAHALEVSRNIDSALNTGLVFDPHLAARLTTEHSATKPCELARAIFRLLALYSAIKLSRTDDYAHVSWLGRRKLPRDIASQARDLSAAFFHCFIALNILEERIEGTLSAFEGIRIVRSRKQNLFQN
jgi:hypothetical protein